MFIGASTQITGTSHKTKGSSCQDRASDWIGSDGISGILVLCDGAGSCDSSEVGAELICEWFPQWVESRTDWWSLLPEEIPPVVTTAIRGQLESEAAQRNIQLHSLSSTFLAITTYRDEYEIRFKILHLGDGVAACIGSNDATVISEPDNGEFANETVFTTSKNAASSLRLTEGRLPHGSGFILMSDGSAASLFLKSQSALAPAVAEMITWLMDHDSATVSQALKTNGEELLTKKTGDDCSIAILLDRDTEHPFRVELPHPQEFGKEAEAAIACEDLPSKDQDDVS